jgi:hypothetical protein
VVKPTPRGTESPGGHSSVTDRSSSPCFHEALAWLALRDTSHPYAFENLCDHLGLNAAWLRRGLRHGGHDTTLHPRSAPRRRERGWYAVADA